MRSIIVTTIYILSIFTPLVLSLSTFELFEFPKFIILLAGTLVIATTWLYHAYTKNDFAFIPKNATPITYAVLAMLATQAVSTIFSIHPYTSFWGYYSRFHGGLLTTILYTIIYLAAIKWLDKKSTQKLIKISVTTAILVGLYAIAERFGIDKNFWIQDVQNRVFSTLGQPNWLAAYLIPNIFLSIYLTTILPNKKITPASIISFLILFIALILTKSRSGLIAFALSFMTYFLFFARQYPLSTIKPIVSTYAIIFIIPLLILGTPFTDQLSKYFKSSSATTTQKAPSGTVLDRGGTESGAIRQIVWTGAIDLIKKYPILGTGPETFAYTYYWSRPAAHNMTSEWDFLYNKAHNEYLNTAATTGLVGLLAYLYFHFQVFVTGFRTIENTKKINQEDDDKLRSLYPVLSATIVGFTITNFFGFSVIPVYFMMMIIAAIPLTINKASEKDSPESPSFVSLFFLIPLVLIYPARLFYSDTLFNKGKVNLDKGQLETAIPLLEKASAYRPKLDLFNNSLGVSYALAAQTAQSSDDPAIKANVEKYMAQALQAVEINRSLNNLHLNNSKSRAKIYLSLATIDPKYTIDAKDELVAARTLAPTEPILAYNLALVYTRLNNIKDAETELKAAIALKPDYQDPYYALALLYEQTKQEAKLPELMNLAKSNLATYSAQLKTKVDKYAK